ncbi:MAG: RNA polymerase sigma factor [Leptospiraceae bacterium]|nr:RNA polymerase sigma factor [Leptospiraceae bacterium]MCB1317409.1 RNA polymerase sigma factor [Leptospiraceae bacterium]
MNRPNETVTDSLDAIETRILRAYRALDSQTGMALFEKEYGRRIFALAYRWLGNSDDAQDALQEILIQVDNSIHRFGGHSRLFTWVYTIALRVCRRMRIERRKKCDHAAYDEELDRPEESSGRLPPALFSHQDPDKLCEEQCRELVITLALQRMKPAPRSILILSEFDHLDNGAIAEILGIRPGTLRTRMHRARLELRRILEGGVSIPGSKKSQVLRLAPSGELI